MVKLAFAIFTLSKYRTSLADYVWSQTRRASTRSHCTGPHCISTPTNFFSGRPTGSSRCGKKMTLQAQGLLLRVHRRAMSRPTVPNSQPCQRKLKFQEGDSTANQRISAGKAKSGNRCVQKPWSHFQIGSAKQDLSFLFTRWPSQKVQSPGHGFELEGNVRAEAAACRSEDPIGAVTKRETKLIPLIAHRGSFGKIDGFPW